MSNTEHHDVIESIQRIENLILLIRKGIFVNCKDQDKILDQCQKSCEFLRSKILGNNPTALSWGGQGVRGEKKRS